MSNRSRFVLAIINGGNCCSVYQCSVSMRMSYMSTITEIVINNRKKMDIMRMLQAKGFKPLHKKKSKEEDVLRLSSHYHVDSHNISMTMF